MLKALTIQDLAVVRELDVEFESGLTILTGETGAGKSILIEALGLALGDRGDSSMVRATAERATVSATFDISGNDPLKAFLRDNDLEDESECILRRVMSADGRSRAFCNVSPIPVQLLKQIGEYLVDIHGQHAHHSLLRRPVMRELLDEFGHCHEHAAAVAAAYQKWRGLTQDLQRLSKGTDDVAGRIELLQFQAEEIETLGLTPESLQSLETEHRRIAHAARILDACETAAALAFAGDGSVLDAAARAVNTLRPVSGLDSGISAAIELLEQAAINLDEAERELDRVREHVDTDPQRLLEIEQRLQTIQDLARKHRCDPEAIPQRLAEIRTELDDLSSREARIDELNRSISAALVSYRRAADALHEHRCRAAATMDDDITRRLRELGIAHGAFSVAVTRNESQPSLHGDDEIEFLVTANPDQPLKPLKKVVSGGELSRVSLAIQVATTGASGIPVLVFDEVDTGIGGPTAEVVGRYLTALAERRQILCITHLAQVASAGDHHLSIGKIVAGGITETTISALNGEERIEELARMLGGRRITEKVREHARELLTH